MQLKKRRELFAYCAADRVATITPEDAFLVRSDLPFVAASTIRMATLHAPKGAFAAFQARYGVLFVGNGFNPTNYISIEWFFEVRTGELRGAEMGRQRPALASGSV